MRLAYVFYWLSGLLLPTGFQWIPLCGSSSEDLLCDITLVIPDGNGVGLSGSSGAGNNVQAGINLTNPKVPSLIAFG